VRQKLKIKMKKYFLAIFLFCFSSQSFAAQGGLSDQVVTFVSDVGNKIVKTANEKNISEEKKREKIIAIIDGVIDSDWIAHFVLGKNYKTAADPQRERFTKLYRDFMINTYGPKFRNYNGRKFEVKEVVEQNGFYVAKAELLPRDSNVAISVDFRVKERGGKLTILDFIAEGISLIETQRSEFNSAIARDGMGKFLDDLSERVRKLKEVR
jgi:phospholipid transport system substrate-binding protein